MAFDLSRTIGRIIGTAERTARRTVDTVVDVFEAGGRGAAEIVESVGGAVAHPGDTLKSGVSTIVSILDSLPQGPEQRDPGSERPESAQASSALAGALAAIAGLFGGGGAPEPGTGPGGEEERPSFGSSSLVPVLLIGGAGLLAVLAFTRRR